MIKKLVLIILVLIQVAPLNVYARERTSGSQIIDRDGEFRFSPPLYEASRVINHDLSGLEDIFIDAYDYIFVARTGDFDAEVVIFDPSETFVKTIGNDVLRSASGVFVTNTAQGRLIYVVDRIARLIYVFNEDNEVLRTIERPTSALFGSSAPFEPRRVVVDQQGIIYIISEGSINGIIKVHYDGEFIGYFGAGMTANNWLRRLQRTLFSEEIMSNFIRNTPTSMRHIAIDSRGIVYATTRGETDEALKKINIAGINLFDNIFPVGFYEDANVNLGDVTVDAMGNIFTYSETSGRIYIIDSEGRIIGSFGKSTSLPSELGITTQPIGIAVNSNQAIFIADRGDGWVVIFEPTPLMELIFTGIAYYNAGLYLEGEPIWREVLAMNSAVAIAHDAIGMSRLAENDYEGALAYFRLSNNRILYSNAFWELRQNIIIAYGAPVLVGLIGFGALKNILKRIDKKTNCFAFYKNFKTRIKQSCIITELRDVLRVLRHPADIFYEIRAKNSVSIISVMIIFISSLLLLVGGVYLSGFIFNEVNTQSVRFFSPIQQGVNYIVVVCLFIISNFLITSIREGLGKFIQIVKGVSLCLIPIIILHIPFLILSNLLTLQEIFILDLINFVMIIWCIILVVIMVIEVHQYELKEAIVSLLLTVFTMIVLFVVSVVIYMLLIEMINFIRLIFQEVLSGV